MGHCFYFKNMNHFKDTIKCHHANNDVVLNTCNCFFPKYPFSKGFFGILVPNLDKVFYAQQQYPTSHKVHLHCQYFSSSYVTTPTFRKSLL